ncbi:MAG TPA: DUF5953 family protein [Myxococcaceae bacterium]|nr:DUF5953 family protein [Myxococcaceae bacterium]
MTDPQANSIRIVVYAPALVRGDGRPLAIVRAMERAFPGLRLEWTISDKGQFVPLPQRDAWFVEQLKHEPFPLVCNGGREGELVTLWGAEISASSGPGGQPLFDVHAKLPLDANGIAAAGDVLEAVSEAAHAFWGRATPFNAATDIVSQTEGLDGSADPPRGLPAIKRPEEIPSPEVPQYLGWLNHWSAAAARAIGFPDPQRDADLLSRARRTASGGWLVQLTGAPLDLDKPAHLDALKRTYERFPRIGGRSSS